MHLYVFALLISLLSGFHTSEGGPDPAQAAYTHSDSNPVSPSPEGPSTMTRIPGIFGLGIVTPSENALQDSSTQQGVGEPALDDKNKRHVPQEAIHNGEEKAGTVISDLLYTVAHSQLSNTQRFPRKVPSTDQSSLNMKATAVDSQTDIKAIQKSPQSDPHTRITTSIDEYSDSTNPFYLTRSGDGAYTDQGVLKISEPTVQNDGHDLSMMSSEVTVSDALSITTKVVAVDATAEHKKTSDFNDVITLRDLKVLKTTKTSDSTKDHQTLVSERDSITTMTSLGSSAKEAGFESHLTTETKVLEKEAGRTNRSPRSTQIVNQTSSNVTDSDTFSSTTVAESQNQTDGVDTSTKQAETSEKLSTTFRFGTDHPTITNSPNPVSHSTDSLEFTTDAQQNTSTSQFSSTLGVTEDSTTLYTTSLVSSSQIPMDQDLPSKFVTSEKQRVKNDQYFHPTSVTSLSKNPNYDKQTTEMSDTSLQFSSSMLPGITTTPWVGLTVTPDTTHNTESLTSGLYDGTESTSASLTYTQATPWTPFHTRQQRMRASETPDSKITASGASTSNLDLHTTDRTTISMSTHNNPRTTEITRADFASSPTTDDYVSPMTATPLGTSTSHGPSPASTPETSSVSKETTTTSSISQRPTTQTGHSLQTMARTEQPKSTSQASHHLTTTSRNPLFLHTSFTTEKMTTTSQWVQTNTGSAHYRFGSHTFSTPSTQSSRMYSVTARTEKDWMHKGKVLIIEDQPAIMNVETFSVLLQVVLEGSLPPNSELVEIEEFLTRVPGYQSQHVTWHRGPVFQSVVTFRSGESISWLGKVKSLLEQAGLKPLPPEGIFVGGVRVHNITVGGLHDNVCSWLYSCPPGFYCVSSKGNASCRSLCHSEYCKHHGICVHKPAQPPVCQCPVGEDFWFMGQQCDLRMTRQRLAGMCLGVLLTVAALMAILAYVAVRRFKNMLVQTKAEQTQSSYRRFNHFDELSARFWRRSWPGSEDSLDNIAFTRSDELLHMRALDRPCCYHDDTLSVASTYPDSVSRLNTVYLHGSQYQWDMSTCSLADGVVDSGKASDLSVCSWPIEPIQWTPFPLLQQLKNTTTIKSSRSRSYCEGMELEDMEKSRTA